MNAATTPNGGNGSSANNGSSNGNGAAQAVIQVLGEIVWLMSQSPAHGAVLHRRSGMALVRSTKSKRAG